MTSTDQEINGTDCIFIREKGISALFVAKNAVVIKTGLIWCR
jgi:hypothetical protein